MKLLLPLLFPLSLGAQTLSEMGFSKINYSDSICEVIERGVALDKDTTDDPTTYFIDSGTIIVNNISEPLQVVFTISIGKHRADIFFLLSDGEWFTLTQVDGKICEDKSKYIYRLLDYLPHNKKI